jgi:periplasmic protein TonB
MKVFLSCFVVFVSFAASAQKEDTIIVAPSPPLPVTVVECGESFLYPDSMAHFPGGTAAMSYFIQTHIRYPEIEKENDVKGTVYISFVVEKDGSITQVTAEKTVPKGPGLTKEAIRVVQLMPKWIPAYMNGQPVRSKMTIPIKFTLL